MMPLLDHVGRKPASFPLPPYLSMPLCPARCTQWNGNQAAFWLLWQQAEEAV